MTSFEENDKGNKYIIGSGNPTNHELPNLVK